jgi:hypothetical protein
MTGNEGQRQRALADQLAQGRPRRLVAFEIGFHRGVVLLDGKLDQLAAPFVGQILQLVADRLDEPRRRRGLRPSRPILPS